MDVRFPFALDSRGQPADPDHAEHVRQLIEQVLFTAPGQRVNRPDFGAGLMEVVFASASDEVVAATELLAQAALERWLGELIDVEQVLVERQESALSVTVRYVLRRGEERRTDLFESTRVAWQT